MTFVCLDFPLILTFDIELSKVSKNPPIELPSSYKSHREVAVSFIRLSGL